MNKDVLDALTNYLATVVAIFGGITIVAVGLVSWISKLFQQRLIDKWQASETKKLEAFKSEMSRANTIVSNLVSPIHNQSQKLNEEQIKASIKLWQSVVSIRKAIPPTIFTIYSILMENEYKKEVIDKAFKVEMAKLDAVTVMNSTSDFINIVNEECRVLLTEKLWLLFSTYFLTIGRLNWLLITGYNNNNIIYWRNDTHLVGFLEEALSTEEITKLKSIPVGSIVVMFNFLESKILEEINYITTGKLNTENAIQQIQRIEKMMILKKEQI